VSEWTEKLSQRQLENVRKETKEKEGRYPNQPQDHIYKDIDSEIRRRKHTTTSNGS